MESFADPFFHDGGHRMSPPATRAVKRDGVWIVVGTCPLCGVEQQLDNAHMFGHASIQCSTEGCTYHETHDLIALGLVPIPPPFGPGEPPPWNGGVVP
jgi:hypothetical protein